jgi:hypothetical protein
MNCNAINSVHIALFLITRDALVSQIVIWNRTLRVSGRILSIMRSLVLYTQQ